MSTESAHEHFPYRIWAMSIIAGSVCLPFIWPVFPKENAAYVMFSDRIWAMSIIAGSVCLPFIWPVFLKENAAPLTKQHLIRSLPYRRIFEFCFLLLSQNSSLYYIETLIPAPACKNAPFSKCAKIRRRAPYQS